MREASNICQIFPNISNISKYYQIFQIFAKYFKYWPELFPISLASHHLHELIKIEGSGAIFVDLLDDVVDVVLGQLVVQLTQDLLQGVCRDETHAILVVDPERLFQLLLQSLLVLLNQELGGQLTKLPK